MVCSSNGSNNCDDNDEVHGAASGVSQGNEETAPVTANPPPVVGVELAPVVVIPDVKCPAFIAAVPDGNAVAAGVFPAPFCHCHCFPPPLFSLQQKTKKHFKISIVRNFQRFLFLLFFDEVVVLIPVL